LTERGVFLKETQGTSWETVVEAWAKSLEHDELAKSTRMDYIAATYNHTSAWLKRPADSINSLDVKELLIQFKVDGKSYKFIRQMKNMLGRIFMYGMERRLIKNMDRPPTFGVPLGRPEEKKPEILTLDEIRKLLWTAN
jgi:hypothetical protein